MIIYWPSEGKLRTERGARVGITEDYRLGASGGTAGSAELGWIENNASGGSRCQIHARSRPLLRPQRL